MPKTCVCNKCGCSFQRPPSARGLYCSRECAKHGISRAVTTHGESRTRLHSIWSHMKTRCLCPTAKAYPYYGGRGITVSTEWIESFTAFRDWAVSSGYQESLELDRINVNGNYEPSNCRWANRVQQMRNTRKRANAKTSRFKGVSKHSQNGNWVVQLYADGKPIHIGVFNNEIDAAKAYDAAATRIYGEFAHLNFPTA